LPIRATAARPAGAAPEVSPQPSPQAARLPRARWLDPRLLVGVVLVLGSVVLGARVVSGADDTVGVWATTSGLAAGASVGSGDLLVRRVRLESGADRYLSVEDPVPAGMVLTRAVGPGELLPAAALRSDDASPVRYVTVAVPRTELPVGTTKGSRVDVWLAPSALDRAGGDQASASADTSSARLILAGAAVEGADSEEGAFGAGDGVVPVVLAVTDEAVSAGTGDRTPGAAGSTRPADAESVVGQILTASRGGRLYLVGAPGPSS
jgi:hypothetical protein